MLHDVKFLNSFSPIRDVQRENIHGHVYETDAYSDVNSLLHTNALNPGQRACGGAGLLGCRTGQVCVQSKGSVFEAG